jgi:hypothetical protein
LRKDSAVEKANIYQLGGRLTLINSVLSSLPMYMMSFLQFQKGFLRNWIILDPGFIGKVMNIRENIDSLSGLFYASLKIRVV